MAGKRQLTYVVLACILVCSDGFWIATKKKFKGTLRPMDPDVCTTQSITFTSELLEPPTSSYSVGFAVKDRAKSRTYVAVEPDRVTQINETTATFTIYNVSLKPEFVSEPFYLFVKSLYWQKFGEWDSTLQLGEITSARIYPLPEKVQDFKCIVLNYMSMKCTWNYGIDYGYNMPEVSFQWRNHLHSNLWNDCMDLNVNDGYCFWKDSQAGYFKDSNITIVITLKQKCGLNVSSEFQVDTASIVKPNPVSGISSDVINSTCIRLLWKTTNSEPQHAKEHRIVVTSNKEIIKDLTMITTRDSERFPHQRMFCTLRPYTDYTFSISIKPTGMHAGYFSDARQIISKTYSDIPSANPELTEGGFSWDHRECERNQQTRRVCVFWKSIKEEQKNGPMKGYEGLFSEVHTHDPHIKKDWAEDSTYGCSTLLCNIDYIFTIKARNINGTSKKGSTIKIPAHISEIEHPKFIVESANNSDVYISWYNEKSFHAEGFTVAWCRNKNGHCESRNEFEWKSFPSDTSDAVLQTQTSPQDYLYGVSVSTAQGSSGVDWQDCVYLKNANPKRKPQNVIVAQGAEDNSLVVTWDKLTCKSDEPYIAKYNIQYNKLNDRKLKFHSVTPSREARIVLKDLEEDQTYLVTVRGVTKDDRFGPDSEPQSGIPVNKTLKPVVVAAITMAVLVFVIFAGLGCFFILRTYQHIARKAIKDAGTITIPDSLDPMLAGSIFGRRYSKDSGYDISPTADKSADEMMFSKSSFVLPYDYCRASISIDNGEDTDIATYTNLPKADVSSLECD